MRCSKHFKDITSTCTWCGKELCKLCVVQSDGNKNYCSNCSQRIGGMVREKQLNTIKAEEAAEKPSHSEYFNFSKLQAREK